MIGNDCKLIELNMKKFIFKFLKENENWEAKSFEKMRQVENLYDLFSDLAKDIRSLTYDKERENTFSQRAYYFFSKLKNWAGGNSVHGMPYLHILRDHNSEHMMMWGDLMHWGIWLFLLHSWGTS